MIYLFAAVYLGIGYFVASLCNEVMRIQYSAAPTPLQLLFVLVTWPFWVVAWTINLWR